MKNNPVGNYPWGQLSGGAIVQTPGKTVITIWRYILMFTLMIPSKQLPIIYTNFC